MQFDSTEDLIKWIKDCPECAASKIQILQMDLDQWKSIVKEQQTEIHRLENELARRY